MASERELRIFQEDKLFDTLMVKTLLGEGNKQKLDDYLETMSIKSQSGMTAEEVDAVKQRVQQLCKKLSR